MSVAEFIKEHGRAFEVHLQTKFINSFWLGAILCRDGERAVSYFPYQPKMDGIAKIGRERIFPRESPKTKLMGVKNKPIFLINIPVAHLPGSGNYAKVTRVVQLLKDETYADCAENSRVEAAQKLAVVFGVNQIRSVDPGRNTNFENYIKWMPVVDGLAYKVFGFFWDPVWEGDDTWKEIRGVKGTLATKPFLSHRVYSRDQAFRILKCLNRVEAELIRQKLEGCGRLRPRLCSQIPYQKIRQTIKDSALTREFAIHLARLRQIGPVFYTTMDADCIKLRTTDEGGYFSLCEQLVSDTRATKGHIPSIMTLGYQLPDDALPVARIAVRVCFAVRLATNPFISGGTYIPEPAAHYFLSGGGKLLENLRKFSFLGTARTERAFESRRAITNGVRAGILNRNHTVIGATGALMTAEPGRMRTPIAEKYKNLSAADLKKKEVLSALRGISQVHFKPLHWAHYLYEGLPADVKEGVGIYGKLSGAMSHAFTVFDPISLIFAYKEHAGGSYTAAFDAIFEIYESLADTVLAGEKDGAVKTVRKTTQLIIDANLQEFARFAQSLYTLLINAKDSLYEHGLTEEWTRKVIDAAHASGRTIFNQFTEEMGNLP